MNTIKYQWCIYLYLTNADAPLIASRKRQEARPFSNPRHRFLRANLICMALPLYKTVFEHLDIKLDVIRGEEGSSTSLTEPLERGIIAGHQKLLVYDSIYRRPSGLVVPIFVQHTSKTLILDGISKSFHEAVFYFNSSTTHTMQL